jgi:sortase (surface protein transpeptidase)
MIRLGLNPDDSLKVPADTEKTGWWSGGVKPGKKGTAVIVGHVDSQRGPAVFKRLGALSNGDRIKVVHNDGSRAAFVVTGRERVAKNSFPRDRVYADTRDPTVRLITCGGEFDEASGHYKDNVIVYGRAA